MLIARHLKDEHLFEAAYCICQHCSPLHGSHHEFQYINAFVGYKTGRINKTKNLITNALEQYKGSVDYSALSASIHLDNKDYDITLAGINSALKIKSHISFELIKGMIYHKKWQFYKAIPIFEAILKNHLDYTKAHINIAVCLLAHTGQFSRSEHHYKTALSLSPSNEIANSYLMSLHYNPEQTAESIFAEHKN